MKIIRSTHARSFLAACFCCVSIAAAAGEPPVDVSRNVIQADRVVVATATEVSAMWRRNSHGDQLIVSHVVLQIEETIKGTQQPSALLEIEGGTLDGFTLRVSDLPEMKVGDRAIFMLDGGPVVQAPHRRGEGILKLEAGDRVSGSSLRLSDIRAISRRVIQ